MVDTVIRAGIAYNFYDVPYSLPAIKKLDRRVIALHKTIYGLPHCMSNAVTQLPHDMFGTKVFSLKNVYITCIGEQLINALNDKGRLGRIYNGLTKHILAKHGGSLQLPRISHHDCIRSPITQTLFLLKTTSGIHLISKLEKIPLLPTPLETQWICQAHNIPTLTPTTSLKYLHKLVLHNITELKQITYPNETQLMTNNEFKYYYDTPTKIVKTALDIARILFYKPTCHNHCPNNCTTHDTPNTLKEKYKIQNHYIPTRRQNAHPPLPPPPEHPNPPPAHPKNHTQFPIHSIIKDCLNTYKDKYQITKIIHILPMPVAAPK